MKILISKMLLSFELERRNGSTVSLENLLLWQHIIKKRTFCIFIFAHIIPTVSVGRTV